MNASSLKLGFVGLGIMGAPMAGHLISAGHQLYVNTLGKVPAQIAESSATQCTTARGVAERADIIFLMLPDTPDVEKVLFGEDGVAAGLKGSSGKVVVDMSSISPVATKDFARRIEAIGAQYLDAPVSGGERGAIDGTLAIMVGGDPATFERHRHLFAPLGRAVHVGPAGSGQLAKLANQSIVANTIATVAEALLLAERGGADPRKVREALMGGFADSTILQVHGERMLDEDFRPGGPAKWQWKDTQTAQALADDLALDLPVSRLVDGLFGDLVANGDGDLDHSALIRELRRRNGERPS